MTAPLTSSGAGGSIFDLGYQRYSGPRLGRRAAILALFWHTFRACFGLGRSARAKVIPWGLGVMALLPAVVAVGFAVIIGRTPVRDSLERLQPIQYATYFGLIATLILLFCAAQAPELFGRDQRYGVMPLYFSRSLTRLDYALARILGLIAALLLFLLVPQALLFIGRVLVAVDPGAGFSVEGPNLLPIVVQSLIAAGVLGGLASVISAYAPRRAHATSTIIGVLLISPIAVAILVRLGGALGHVLVLLSPSDVIEATNRVLFGREHTGAVLEAGLPDVVWLLAAVAWIVVTVGLTLRRYLRMAA